MTARWTPSCASAWQMRCPNPPLPPVTSATMPFRSIASLRLHHRLHTRYCHDEIAEPGAANFEIAVLVERGAGRRQQHHGIGEPRGFGVARGVGDGDIERLR